jgi:NADPH:quinone reductase-like Zn-dependent oxidoreductase/acyl carrier protein
VESTAPAAQLPASTGFVLEMTETGSFDDLTYRAVNRVAPEDLQVEVAVSAAGLNFLDAMTALGQVPTLDCVDEYRFGAECAGVVTRIGARVTGLSVGDEVVAVSGTQGALASHITLDEKCVAPKPAELSFEEAASVPIVFLTAWYGLHKLARLEAGEKVLIHSAAGGTGLAAIQIARLLGAEVFATAGSEEKRDLLRSLGIEHVMDSRSLTFADEVLAATGGAGVDVVISAAVGELADRTMACVAPYGRYVEIGKKDLLTDRKIGLRPFLRNLAYFAFDLRQLLVDRPAAVRAELDTLLDLFRSGSLRPLPFRVFHPSQTETAFRHLASARHIGKLVIALDEQEIEVAAARAPAAPQGTWLITGGCGGVGLGMAEALVDSGVRSLVLLGRGGAESVEARARVAGLRSRGAGVVVEAVDVTCRTELEGVFERIARDLPPLRGVLHCAMVLDDALITAVTPEQVRRVLAPKVDGARHLNSLTEKLDLDAFVLFSSAASLVGNIGQAHYAAANAYLDQLAEARHAAGLPALSVHWGAVSDAGYVARHPEVARLVEATGMRGFPVRQAFAAMTTLWRGPYARVAVIPMNWPQFFRHHAITPQRNPRYALLTSEAQLGGASSGGPLSVQLRSQTSDGRAELLKSRLKERVATVLGIPLAELDESMPLMDYLDSLLAVEISSWLEREVGVKVTIIELMKGPSVSQLTEDLLARIEVPSQRSSTELFEFAKV